MTAPTTRLAVVLAASLLVGSTRVRGAERQIRPFAGATFAGSTTFVDPELAVPAPNIAIGASAALLGEIFGVEVDVGDMPGLFGSGDSNLVRSSRVTSVTGNVIVAAPHRLTEYALRPYIVAGAGVMRVRTTTAFNVFDVAAVLPTMDLGGGAIGFITNRIGVCWDIRRFQGTRRGQGENGLTTSGEEHLSFWRGTMAVVIRY
jgi:hypothetical protein